MFFYGAYEKCELEFFIQLLKKIKDSIVIDVGANFGHHTLFFSNYSSELYSFEPYDDVRKSLFNKLVDNNIQNVIVNDFDLLEYYAPTKSNTVTDSFLKDHASDNNFSSKKFFQVKIGDQYFSSLNLSKIDFIKIDVEISSLMLYLV
jgi:FkbM family methyltransferase